MKRKSKQYLIQFLSDNYLLMNDKQIADVTGYSNSVVNKYRKRLKLCKCVVSNPKNRKIDLSVQAECYYLFSMGFHISDISTLMKLYYSTVRDCISRFLPCEKTKDSYIVTLKSKI